MFPKVMIRWKRTQFVRSFTKKNQKVLMKIDEMTDVFLNSSNFAQQVLLTLAPPSGYDLNLKALIKVSKVSWTSQLSYKILRSSFERKFDKANFISPKNGCQKYRKNDNIIYLVLRLYWTFPWSWNFHYPTCVTVIVSVCTSSVIALLGLQK